MGGLAGDAITTGTGNVAIGLSALTTDTLGGNSVAVGMQALMTQNFTSTTSAYNTAVGHAAGAAVTTGVSNTLIGGLAGDAITDADYNVALGYGALSGNTVGSSSVAIGTSALFRQNPASAAHMYNVAVGHNSGEHITTGIQNTFIGGLAGDAITTGADNTIIGYDISASAVSGTRQIAIGSRFTAGGDGTVRIGTQYGTATLNIDGSDTSWAAASDARLKKDVADSTVGLSFVNALRPVTFKWNAKNAVANNLPQYDASSSDPVYGEGKAHHGFIAQEVKAVIDANSDVVDGHNIWVEDPDGTQQVAPSALVPILVKAIQEQQALIESLTARITTLEG